MSVFKTLFMEEKWELMVDGNKVDAIKKNGKFYETRVNGKTGAEIDIMKIQKKHFVKSPLPQMPASGYTGRGDNYSKMSLEWLKWTEKELGRPLQTALSDEGEHRVLGASRRYRVDGYDAKTHTAYEFHGCR